MNGLKRMPAGMLIVPPTNTRCRASFDVRHRVFVGGTISMPAGIRLSPFMIASSGSPFNIVTGQTPLFGNGVFNTRPTAGTCGDSGVMSTVYGCFNLVTQPGQTVIPINEATGPGRFTLNLRVSKTFGFGEKKETAARGDRKSTRLNSSHTVIS